MSRFRQVTRAVMATALVLTGALVGALFSGVGAASAASSTPITIGMICSCSGPLASSTAITPLGYRAWVEMTNAQGGINGHKINFILKDDAANSGTSLSDAQTLVGQDHATALVDASVVDAAWSTYASQNNVPVIGANSSSAPFYLNPDFFAPGQTEDQLFASIVGAAKEAGAKNMALFYCAEAATCQEGVAPLKATAAADKTPLVYDASISASSPNYTAQCLAAKQAGAQSLFIADAVQVVESVAASCSQQGWNPKIIIDGESLAPAMAKSPGLNHFTVFTNPNIPTFSSQNAGVRQMNAAFEKYEPEILKSSQYNEIAVQAWVSAAMLGLAGKNGGLGANGTAPTSAELLAGLYQFRGNTVGGMAPPLTFAKGKAANPVDCWQGYSVLKGGKFSTPYGLGPNCASTGTAG